MISDTQDRRIDSDPRVPMTFVEPGTSGGHGVAMVEPVTQYTVDVQCDTIDHLIYAVPDVDSAVGRLEEQLGVRAIPGGRHPAFGTRNALLALGPSAYLEIMGPDRNGGAFPARRILGIDDLVEPRLATWAVRDGDLDDIVARALDEGVDLGHVRAGSRIRPDGSELSWRLTDPRAPREDGLVPLVIDWDDMDEHPARSLPTGCSLVSLHAVHPESDRVGAILRAIGFELPVSEGPAPALVAMIETPRGIIELR